jgi:hypothetical protein
MAYFDKCVDMSVCDLSGVPVQDIKLQEILSDSQSKLNSL